MAGREYDDNLENLNILVELTKKINQKDHFIRAQTAELYEQNRTLALAESRLILLLDMTPMGMMITLNRVITYANKRMADITGYKKSELIGKSTRLLYDSDEQWVKIGSLQTKEGDTSISTNLTKKDGTKSDCVIRMTRIMEAEQHAGEEFVVTLYVEKDANPISR